MPHVQRDQPPGVPPLELTGERTLPDLPEENYWFRRHLAVYEWIVFLQTIEHVAEPAPLLERFATVAPVGYVSTPNRLTLAPPGAEKSDNPWHLREYDPGQYRALLETHFGAVEILG